MRNIFGEGEYIICSGEGKYLEKKKRKNIWRREIFFAEEIIRRKIFEEGKCLFCGDEKRQRRKRRKLFI